MSTEECMDAERKKMRDRHVQVRLSQEEYEKLERDAKTAGLKLQGYLQELIAASPNGPNPYASHAGEHDMLEYVLTNDRVAADWIRGNLHMFVEAIHSRPGAQKRKKVG